MISERIIVCLRIASALVGSVSLYSGLFLYEDEEGKIKNVLEEWWIRVDDAGQSAIRMHTRFMRATAVLARSLLNKRPRFGITPGHFLCVT
jgi:hypothetical protein